MTRLRYLILTGIPGTGKTTILRNIASMLKPNKLFVEKKGVFLERFYSDPTYAFLNQLDYTTQFLEQANQIALTDKKTWVLQDRSIFDTHEVFSSMLFDSGLISKEKFSLLKSLYDIGVTLCTPSLIVLLSADPQTCLKRIKTRNDKEEKEIDISYLSHLLGAYKQWFDSFSLSEKIIVSTEDLNPKMVAIEIIKALETSSQD